MATDVRERLWPWAKLRRLELENWQMREALGYPIPNAVDRRFPRQLAGNCGVNPFKCGKCGAREKYPHLHKDE